MIVNYGEHIDLIVMDMQQKYNKINFKAVYKINFLYTAFIFFCAFFRKIVVIITQNGE